MPKYLIAPSLIVFGLACAIAAQDTKPGTQQFPPDIFPPLLGNKVAPICPRIAREPRIQGTVILDIIINQSGEVSEINLVSGQPMLVPAAIVAVKQWRYRPFLLNGQPIQVETLAYINFTLAHQ